MKLPLRPVPSCATLKILPPAAVPAPHGAAGPYSPRRHHRRRAGHQVRSPKCPTCPSGPAFALARIEGSPAHVQLPCGPGIRPYPASRDHPRPGPAAPLSCCLSAAGVRFIGTLSRHDSAPLTVAYRPASHTRTCTADPGEVSMFRTPETRTGPGLLTLSTGDAVSRVW